MCIVGSFPGEKAAGDVKLTTHLHIMPGSRVVELNLNPPPPPNGVMLNEVQGHLYILRVTVLRVLFAIDQYCFPLLCTNFFIFIHVCSGSIKLCLEVCCCFFYGFLIERVQPCCICSSEFSILSVVQICCLLELVLCINVYCFCHI
jgi:hypothetical protein